MRLIKAVPICVITVFLLGLFYCASMADMEMTQEDAIAPTVGQNIVPTVEQVIEIIPVVEDNNEVTINADLLDVYSENIISEVYNYIYATCSSNGYRECTIFDILDEDEYMFLHIVFDNIQYKGISVNKDPINICEVYNCKLTSSLIEYWEYN